MTLEVGKLKQTNNNGYHDNGCNRGYLSNWGIIIELISTIDLTEYITCPFWLLVVIFPTPKKDWFYFINVNHYRVFV